MKMSLRRGLMWAVSAVVLLTPGVVHAAAGVIHSSWAESGVTVDGNISPGE
jgi:hypothetical protein